MTSALGTRSSAAPARQDGELMKQIASGRTEAFEELYDRHYARAYRIARSICLDDGRAEEAVQDAFVSIWRNPDSYQADRGAVGVWLLLMVRHRAIDANRRHGRHADRRADAEKIDLLHDAGDMAENIEERDEATKLNTLIARLPDAQQEVIALAFFAQLTHQEIAAQLGLPPGTVKGRMRLGLKKLRADLDQVDRLQRWRTALAFALYGGELEQGLRIVREAISDIPAATVLDDVLAPAMHRIGALWERREITIADEHLATATAYRLLTGSPRR